MGTSKLNKISQLSDCLTEQDTAYPGNDVNNGASNIQPDVESCRASCGSMGAGYFTHLTLHSTQFNECWCKSSNAVLETSVGRVSGETCSGETNFSMVHTLYSIYQI